MNLTWKLILDLQKDRIKDGDALLLCNKKCLRVGPNLARFPVIKAQIVDWLE